MNGKAFASGLKRYVGSLIATIVFPILWMQSLRLASRHADVDPRARMKMIGAIGISVLIGLGGAYMLLGLQSSATAGFYQSLDDRLSVTLGESAYQGFVETVNSKPDGIRKIQANLDRERSAGNDTTALEKALSDAEAELAAARENVTLLTPNHQLYLQVHEAAVAQDDARIRQLIASTPLERPKDIPKGVDHAFAVKENAVSEMRNWMVFMLWPSLIGAFFAPVAFAHGSILRRAFVPSDTVGFKPYPGGAAGWFLLFGAFGLPSLPFAAWAFLDAQSRSTEGQISL
jgi:hypothetical protein